ncbi:hypothetical protein QWZ16_17935 [Vibrio ostreicida]|uniref:Uncharacterized protein n=1 Tax=Vibrio ostreicida TaxID=526588 RepID=A0ABT8BZF6_9VIBR|nr:hypothetical protein [Vibrio ostreicida]MDN3611482.1 hypothetical protein [Vibrio ostreicida]
MRIFLASLGNVSMLTRSFKLSIAIMMLTISTSVNNMGCTLRKATSRRLVIKNNVD